MATATHPNAPVFYTEQQMRDAFTQMWQRLTREYIDTEALSKEKELTYYNTPFKTIVHSEYDIRFHFDLGYDQKTKRCDRHNLDVVRENIFKEEELRKVPIVVSHNYGHRKTDLEGRTLYSFKKQRVMKEMLRRNKVNMQPTKKFPPKGFEYL